MASTRVTVTITVDSNGFTKSMIATLEAMLAAAVEPAVKRELRKSIAELRANVESV